MRSLGPRVKSDQSTAVETVVSVVVDCGSGGAAQAAREIRSVSFVKTVKFTRSQ